MIDDETLYLRGEISQGRANKIYCKSTLSLVFVFLFSCSPSLEKLDEVVLYESAHYKLKLVRHIENIPLHFTGEVFTILCSSEHTKRSAAYKRKPAGWKLLTRGTAFNSTSAAEVAENQQQLYRVVDDKTLIWINRAFNISYDACGKSVSWSVTSLSKDMIIPMEKPDYCRPKGKVDCRYYDFNLDRTPRFENIQATSQGSVSFVVHSRAFIDGKSAHVKSADFAKTWQVEWL